MRRPIMQKRANSQDVDADDIEKFLIEAKSRIYPHSSLKELDSEVSESIVTESSNASFKNSTRADKAWVETSEDKTSVVVKGIRSLVCYSFDYSKRTRRKTTEAKTDLYIKGRPLTAYSVYSSKKKIQNKKPSSLLPLAQESFRNFDPRVFDEEYTSIEDYTRLIYSERKTSPRQILPNPVTEKPKDPSENSLIVPVPVRLDTSTLNRPLIGFIHSNKFGFKTSSKSSSTTRGKILKGPCTKPSSRKASKMFHNILIS
jgi:hypothetical protein